MASSTSLAVGVSSRNEAGLSADQVDVTGQALLHHGNSCCEFDAMLQKYRPSLALMGYGDTS
jgi:hypothetical protein